MKKTLLSLACALMGFTAMAANVTVDFATADNNSWVPQQTETAMAVVNATDPVSNVPFSFYISYRSGSGTSGYLMVKTKGYVTATPGIACSQITVHTSSGASTAVTMGVKVGDDIIVQPITLSAKNSDFTFDIPAANQAAGTAYTLYVGNSKNAQLTQITFVEATGGPVQQDAGLEFDAETATATLGQAFTAPVLANPNNLAVTYVSSNPTVATVAADGVVTPLADGKTVIIASSAETAQFRAGEAQYVLTVNDPNIIKDELTQASFYGFKNSYAFYNDTTDYAIHTVYAYKNNGIQLNTSKTTETHSAYFANAKPGYKIKSVTIDCNFGSKGTIGIDVYSSTSAYTESSCFIASDTNPLTSLATLTKDGVQTYTFDNAVDHVALVPNVTSAVLVNSIKVVYEAAAAPSYPQLYVAGDMNSWNVTAPMILDPDAAGIYTFTVVDANQAFKISTDKGTWQKFNAGAMGISDDDVTTQLEKDQVTTLVPGKLGNISTPGVGNWTVTIDYPAMTIVCTGQFKLTGAPDVYLTGSMNDWHFGEELYKFTDTGETTANNEIVMTLSIPTLANGATFKLCGPDGFDSFDLGGLSTDYHVSAGCTYQLDPQGSNFVSDGEITPCLFTLYYKANGTSWLKVEEQHQKATFEGRLNIFMGGDYINDGGADGDVSTVEIEETGDNLCKFTLTNFKLNSLGLDLGDIVVDDVDMDVDPDNDETHYSGTVEDMVLIPVGATEDDAIHANVSVSGWIADYLNPDESRDIDLWINVDWIMNPADPTQTMPILCHFFAGNITSGVDDIAVDQPAGGAATVEYYNLQGARIANPAAGQVVIARQGAKVAKQLVK